MKYLIKYKNKTLTEDFTTDCSFKVLDDLEKKGYIADKDQADTMFFNNGHLGIYSNGCVEDGPDILIYHWIQELCFGDKIIYYNNKELLYIKIDNDKYIFIDDNQKEYAFTPHELGELI